jgi:hypothetical protein
MATASCAAHVRFRGQSGHDLSREPTSALLGAERTCPFALHMSANDPKRTSDDSWVGLEAKVQKNRKGPLLTERPFQFLLIINRDLVDDLHHASSAGLNKNRTVVHVGVPVTRHVVFGRHLIIGDTLLG